MSFLLLLMYTLQQYWRKGQNRLCLKARGFGGRGKGQRLGEEMAQTMYTLKNK
jgi:hypothetical protein